MEAILLDGNEEEIAGLMRILKSTKIPFKRLSEDELLDLGLGIAIQEGWNDGEASRDDVMNVLKNGGQISQ